MKVSLARMPAELGKVLPFDSKQNEKNEFNRAHRPICNFEC